MRANDSKQGQQATPGPWTIEKSPSGAYDIYSTLDGGDDRVCELVDGEANARLISAAPELLEALHKIHSNAAESVEWIRRVADAAIAKAEGR